MTTPEAERREAEIRWVYSELAELIALALADVASGREALTELEGSTIDFVHGEIRSHEGWIFHATRLLNVLTSVVGAGYDPFDADDEAVKWVAERPGPPRG